MRFQTDPACGGTGMIGDAVCEACGGTGRLPLKETCPDCGGDQVVLVDDEFVICSTCYGAGVLPIEGIVPLMMKSVSDINDKVNDIKEKVDEIKAVVDNL